MRDKKKNVIIIIIAGVEIDDHPMQIEETQYPKTFFYKEDLHPGKTMKVQFSKPPFQQPWGVGTWLKEIKDTTKEGYSFEELCIKKEAIEGEEKFCAKSLGTVIGFAISLEARPFYGYPI